MSRGELPGVGARQRGRPPKSREVAEAAGGVWSPIEACWQFDDVTTSRRSLPVASVSASKISDGGTRESRPKIPALFAEPAIWRVPRRRDGGPDKRRPRAFLSDLPSCPSTYSAAPLTTRHHAALDAGRRRRETIRTAALRDRAAHQGEAHPGSMAAQQGWDPLSAYLRSESLGDG